MLNSLVLYRHNCSWNGNISNNKSNRKLSNLYQHDRNSLLCYLPYQSSFQLLHILTCVPKSRMKLLFTAWELCLTNSMFESQKGFNPCNGIHRMKPFLP